MERKSYVKAKSLAEAAEGGVFVALHVEDRNEPGDLEDVMNATGELQQLHFAAGSAYSRVSAYEFADSGAVDVVDVREVEQDLAMAGVKQAPDRVAQDRAALTQRDFPAEIDDGYVIYFSACAL